MDKLDARTDGATLNIVEQNIDKLRELFPDAFTEASDEKGPPWKVNIEALGEILGQYVEDQPDRYSFTWNGKARARRIAQTPSTGTLRPCPEESVNWDTTQIVCLADNISLKVVEGIASLKKELEPEVTRLGSMGISSSTAMVQQNIIIQQ